MPNSLPCPNPTCTQVFPAEKIKGASALKCPKCGTVFHIRSAGKGAAPPAASAKPPAKSGTEGAAPGKPAAKSGPPAKSPLAKPAASKPVPGSPAVAKPGRPANPPASPPGRTPAAKPGIPVAAPVAPPPGKKASTPATPATPEPEPAPAPPDGDDFFFDDPLPADEAKPDKDKAAQADGKAATAKPAGESPDGKTAEAASNPEEEFAAEPVITYVPRRASNLMNIFLGFLAALILLGSVGLSIFWALQEKEKEAVAEHMPVTEGRLRNLSGAEETVFKLTVSKKVWTEESGFRSRLRAAIALRRSEPEAWFAIATKDYGTTKPREAVLIKEGIDKLENLFGEDLELAAKVEKLKEEQLAPWGGIPVRRLEFRGRVNAVVWRGDMYMFTRNGIGYWFFLAGSHQEDVQRELQALQENNSFVVNTERRGWTELPPKMETYKAVRLNLQLQAPPGVWEKFNPLDEDERAELVLVGRYLKEKDNLKNASVVVLDLVGQPTLKEGIQVAFEELQKRKQIENPEATVESLADKDEPKADNKDEPKTDNKDEPKADNKDEPKADNKDEPKTDTGPPEAIGSQRGKILEYKLVSEGKPRRYIILAVINDPAHLLAINCECSWKSRSIWRQDILDLLQTLTWKKGE